ncbi:hypothetical protein Hanom_Chr17g01538111 [Helianthus anomalus]
MIQPPLNLNMFFHITLTRPTFIFFILSSIRFISRRPNPNQPFHRTISVYPHSSFAISTNTS